VDAGHHQPRETEALGIQCRWTFVAFDPHTEFTAIPGYINSRQPPGQQGRAAHLLTAIKQVSYSG